MHTAIVTLVRLAYIYAYLAVLVKPHNIMLSNVYAAKSVQQAVVARQIIGRGA